jgi:hypothetical protein
MGSTGTPTNARYVGRLREAAPPRADA